MICNAPPLIIIFTKIAFGIWNNLEMGGRERKKKRPGPNSYKKITSKIEIFRKKLMPLSVLCTFSAHALFAFFAHFWGCRKKSFERVSVSLFKVKMFWRIAETLQAFFFLGGEERASSSTWKAKFSSPIISKCQEFVPVLEPQKIGFIGF